MSHLVSMRRTGAAIAASLAAIALAAPASAEPSPVQSKVANGRDADVGEIPGQVSLVTADAPLPDGHFCGGTLLFPDWALTAGHCFTEGAPELPDVVAGTIRLDGSGQRVAATQVIVHPGYRGSDLRDDIALVRLATPISGVALQRLAVPGLELLEEPRPAFVSGWGGLRNLPPDDNDFPVALQIGDTPIITDEECNAALAPYDNALGSPAQQVCAGDGRFEETPRDDACQGDSGGPLWVRSPAGDTRQVGLVSFGPTCGESPSAYTSVLAYLDFIEATTGRQVAAFADIPGNVHEANIERIAYEGVTQGDSTGQYAARSAVTRGQMATFIGRALGLTPRPDENPYSDIDGNTHQGFIAALAAEGIVGGFPDGSYRPDAPVDRGQMATFLARARDLAGQPDGPFSDVDGNVHEGSINAIAAAGFTGGFPDGTYRPGGEVFRDQMASFLARAFYAAG